MFDSVVLVGIAVKGPQVNFMGWGKFKKILEKQEAESQ